MISGTAGRARGVMKYLLFTRLRRKFIKKTEHDQKQKKKKKAQLKLVFYRMISGTAGRPGV